MPIGVEHWRASVGNNNAACSHVLRRCVWSASERLPRSLLSQFLPLLVALFTPGVWLVVSCDVAAPTGCVGGLPHTCGSAPKGNWRVCWWVLCVAVSIAVILSLLSRSGDVETNPGPGFDLVSDNLPKLRNLIWDARGDWFDLGLELGIKRTALEVIEQDNRAVTKKCFTDMLSEWLKMVNPLPSWEGLIAALKTPAVGRADFAKAVEKELGIAVESEAASVQGDRDKNALAMPKGRCSSTKSDTESSSPHHLKFEQALTTSLTTALIGIGVAIGTYFCKQYWEKFPNVSFYETLGIAVCVCGISLLILYLDHLLYRVFSNKGYATIGILVIFLTLAVGGYLIAETWHTNNKTNGLAEKMDFFKSLPTEKTEQPTLNLQRQPEKDVENLRTPQPDSQAQPSSIPNEPLRNDQDSTADPVEFNGDCQKYSRQLLSQPNVFRYTKKYNIDGQVEMFRRTILLKGKPTGLAITREPTEYEGNAEYIFNRHLNTEAHSSVCLDAVEKALVKMCENLRGGSR